MARPKQRRGSKVGTKLGHYPTAPQACMWDALRGKSYKQDYQDMRKRGLGGLTINLGSLKMGGGKLQLVKYQGRLQSNHSRTWRNEQARPAMPVRAEARRYPRFTKAN